MRVGIVGGGMMGLATAHYLSKADVDICLFEKEDQIGGLSRPADILPDLKWDQFYHVILTTDEDLLEFLDDIGIGLDLHFKQTKTGFFTNGKIYSMSSSYEFLRFEPLRLFDKIRLAFGILYASRLENWRKLEQIYVKTWLIRVFGRRNYEKMWDPLLRAKLGNAKDQVSAAFIWGIIKRLYGARKTGAKKEMFGCVSQGYHSILVRIKDELLKKGVVIHTQHRVANVKSEKTGLIGVYTDEDHFEFDKVVLTIPNPEIKSLLPQATETFKETLDKVRYLKLVCGILVLKKSLSPYYVMNLTDPELPFTGFIEATNIIPDGVLRGRALVYLPKYMDPDDPFYERPDDHIEESFLAGVQKIFSDFNKDDIIKFEIVREEFVQPIQSVNYSNHIQEMNTPLKNIHYVNTSMILNSTLNNNEVVRLSKKLSRIVLESKI